MSRRVLVIHDPMTPGEYELFYAMSQLWSAGKTRMRQRDILHLVNDLRKQKHMKPLSWENFYYHLSKLLKKPFVERNGNILTLKPGVYKLVRPAPMCIFIGKGCVIGIMCVFASECDAIPFSDRCRMVPLSEQKLITMQ